MREIQIKYYCNAKKCKRRGICKTDEPQCDHPLPNECEFAPCTDCDYNYFICPHLILKRE